MSYVYVKDSEGYVFKKLKSEVCKGEKIITEKAYRKASGLTAYEKQADDHPDACYARGKGFPRLRSGARP